MDVAQVTVRFGLRLPAAHLRCLANPTDPIHDACAFLVLTSENPLLCLDAVNDFLRDERHHDPWPSYLAAFASNGCGDYFAYDTRSSPPTIV